METKDKDLLVIYEKIFFLKEEVDRQGIKSLDDGIQGLFNHLDKERDKFFSFIVTADTKLVTADTRLDGEKKVKEQVKADLPANFPIPPLKKKVEVKKEKPSEEEPAKKKFSKKVESIKLNDFTEDDDDNVSMTFINHDDIESQQLNDFQTTSNASPEDDFNFGDDDDKATVEEESFYDQYDVKGSSKNPRQIGSEDDF